MVRWRPFAYLLPQLWRTLRARPITVRYPFAPLQLPPYFRGRVVVETELCRGCGACVRDCPAFGLELERRSGGGFCLLLHPDRCASCGQCEMSCPAGAIRLVDAYWPATTKREELIEVLVEREGGDAKPK